jgi:hypothetical protein
MINWKYVLLTSSCINVTHPVQNTECVTLIHEEVSNTYFQFIIRSLFLCITYLYITYFLMY